MIAINAAMANIAGSVDDGQDKFTDTSTNTLPV